MNRLIVRISGLIGILFLAGCSGLSGTSLKPQPTPLAIVSTSAAARIVATLPPAKNVPAVKAGEIDDNRLWKDYLVYRDRSVGLRNIVHDVDISERHTITVTDIEGTAVLGARVRVYTPNSDRLIHVSYTYANGQTLFFPRTQPNIGTTVDVFVDKGNVQKNFVLTRTETSDWRVSLEVEKPQTQRTQLDVLFLLDTTGSMDDELQRLQANILSVSSQIDALPGQPDVRYGLVAYRDRGDEYITRIDPFTNDVKTFQTRLNALRAGGGGDTPESLNAGLHDAIHGVEWRDKDTIKLVFLVADATPHLDYTDDYDYAIEMREATKKGIKIYSLAASGLTDQGEYIFRQLAQYTMGHFIFITYQQPGQTQGQNPVDSRPGDDSNMNVPKENYQTELLDQLVVRLVRQEVAALTSRP